MSIMTLAVADRRDEQPTAPAGIDWGRMVIVPLSVLAGAAAVGRMFVLARTDGDAYATVSGIAAAALTGMFYVLLIWGYLRRDRARATATKPAVLVAAPMATFLPLTLPHLASTAPSMMMVVLADLLLLGGLVWSVWSVGHLSRCLSVLPQARTLVDRGPYRFVRHPLYSGEIVSMLGLALALGGTAPLLAWLGLTALQCYRAAQEEQLLRVHVPGYPEYQERTARVLPGIY